jgi:hypothetical protein
MGSSKGESSREFQVRDKVKIISHKCIHEAHQKHLDKEGVVDRNDHSELPYRINFEGNFTWAYADEVEAVEKVKGKRGRPSTKLRPVKFLLKHDLDVDPIEEFETMDQVNERIKQLLERSDLKRDSMVVYEIKSKKQVKVETKISIK